MGIDEVKQIFNNRYSQLNIYFEQSGIAIWVSMNDGESNYVEVQVTPNQGVGVSKIQYVEEIDFGGHDEVFNSLDEALNYLDQIFSK
ncbi:hypothetical protein B5M42_004920 [Paenibacillus athensensis]|uniref:Uncharacterized protein n=1 Tax=Paenibacillus athensensis TaxID=1967502 RepID=A0A4Y8PVR2_9BACL|nr:hypothetical protein [Paenibacillus athensensis]MCD1258181.1 hypothetical protein [Paenibacillus athensensis]